MKRFMFSLMTLPALAQAAPFIVSDPVTLTPAITHCGWYVDALAKEVLPVVAAAGGVQCKKDFAGEASGQHTVRATHIIKDAIWGDRESAQSAPFAFGVPPLPGAPSALKLVSQ